MIIIAVFIGWWLGNSDKLVLIQENENTISRSEYVIAPNFYYENDDDDKPVKTSLVTFYRDSIVEIKNDFNLKSFPFDRQKLTLKLFGYYETAI